MAAQSDDPNKALEPSSSSSSPSHQQQQGWKELIAIPTLLAGVVGAGAGLLSKYSKVHGVANMSASYAANFAIVTASYCGAREFVKASRHSDDLLNSAIGGFGAGALLGRIQGGRMGAIRYSLIFAVAGTMVDYAAPKLRPLLNSFRESISEKKNDATKDHGWLRVPEWSPIQVLDEEALAEKHAREEKLAERTHGIVEKKQS